MRRMLLLAAVPSLVRTHARLLGAVLGGLAVAAAGADVPNVALVWELMSPEPRQAAALAEVRLADDDGMRLLDREQIGAVLREHATALRQASPQTSGFTLGQLLGADVLVRVHEEERPDPSGGAPEQGGA